MHGFESEGEDTKITKSKLDDKPDQLKDLKNMENVKGTPEFVASRCTPYTR